MKNDESNQLESKATKGVIKLALEAMKSAPWEAKIIIFIQASLYILVICTLVTLNNAHSVYVIISILLVLGFSFYVVRYFIGSLKKQASIEIWSRKYINNTKADAKFQKVGKEFTALLKNIIEYILDITNNKIEKENIRGNIFIPDCTNAKDGFVFRLYIPTPLRWNMNRQQEWGIRFHPGEGSTGLCFHEGIRRITLRKDFMISDEFKDSIHPDLKWIISIPLMSGKDYAIGVLNIDGMVQELSKDVLNKIVDKCQKEVKSIEKSLCKLPMTNLTVSCS